MWRRVLVFQAFLLWQGGFVVYAAIVVPIGTELLGSAALQGTITQQVTRWLNLLGVGWCAVMTWELASTWKVGGRPWTRAVILALSAGLLAGLFAIHPIMSGLMDAESARVVDKPTFRRWHIAYLWISTLHWLLALVLTWLTLSSWRAQDRAASVTSST